MAAPRLALAVFVLLLAVISMTEGIRGRGPKKCCFNFNEKPLDKGKVVSYTRTSQRCSNPAILLRTTGGQLCVRPSDDWVKRLISDLDARPLPGKTSHL